VTKRGYDVVRCTACRLVFVWPQPTREELEALYSSGTYHAALDETERRRYFARRLRQVEGLVPQRGRLLDVGCSKGLFLEVARAEGWDAVGIELNRNAVEEARARGLDVHQGEVADQPFEAASFDVITLFDLIEHARDPRATLAACHRLLRPEGILVVTTPDIGGLVPRVTYWLFARTLGAWEHPTPPGHLFQFSRKTLIQMLANSGFTVAARRSEHIPIAYSVGKLENSILDVLTGRHRTKPEAKPIHDGDLGDATSHGPQRRGRWARGMFRCGVRGLSWVVIATAGLVARGVGWGDSMLVVARRAGGGGPRRS